MVAVAVASMGHDRFLEEPLGCALRPACSPRPCTWFYRFLPAPAPIRQRLYMQEKPPGQLGTFAVLPVRENMMAALRDRIKPGCFATASTVHQEPL